MERALEKLAEPEGLCLADIGYEHQPGYHGTFYRLTAKLKGGTGTTCGRSPYPPASRPSR